MCHFTSGRPFSAACQDWRTEVPARLVDMSRDLHFRLKQFFDAPLDGSATPLEIGLAVLNDVERRVEPLGRGRRAFPYTSVTVQVLADEAERARFASALQTLDQRIRERLAELRCDPPGPAIRGDAREP